MFSFCVAYYSMKSLIKSTRKNIDVVCMAKTHLSLSLQRKTQFKNHRENNVIFS